MRSGRVADAVQRFDDGVERRIDADAHVGAPDVVVDAARHANDRKAKVVQGQSARHAAIAPDDHQALNAGHVEAAQGLVLPPQGTEFILARRLQYRATTLQNAADPVAVKQLEIPAKTAAECLAHALHLNVVLQPGAHHRPDGSIHARSVTAAGHHCDALHHLHSLSREIPATALRCPTPPGTWRPELQGTS